MTRALQSSPERRPQSDYDGFCLVIRKHAGLDLLAYKRGQMERRIRVMAERAGADNLQAFAHLLTQDPLALQDFLRHVTINVSEFFRNGEKFEELRDVILPDLLRRHSRLSIWSAGCSFGAEPYSVAMILQEMMANVSFRIHATDIDSAILDRARTGIFTQEEVKSLSSQQLQRYFIPVEGGYQVTPSLQRTIHFSQHDLLRDECPQQLDLILCRNVVIYFSDEAKYRLFCRFFHALRPGGYLFIGSTERITDAGQIGFVSPRPFFYQKPINC